MEPEDIKKAYGELSKKLNLPDFGQLDHDFEVSTLETERFLLAGIRRKIAEKIELHSKMIEELIQPDATLNNLHEVRDLDEDQKKEVYDLYRELMGHYRESFLVGVENEDEKNAAFIMGITKAWPGIKSQLKRILTVMRDSWKSSKVLAETLEYLG